MALSPLGGSQRDRSKMFPSKRPRENGLRANLLWIAFLMSHPAWASQTSRSTPHCTLDCQNGGKCVFTLESDDERSRQVQSGRMIQTCVCPQGFMGMACDVPADECDITRMRCRRNEVPCTEFPETNTFSCNCAGAENLSLFAAMMCRKPFTEYCSGGYDPDTELPFCTNGGKCKSSVVAALVAPGNTSVNLAYQHLGCICPDDFYGPHCELLRYDRATFENPEWIHNNSSDTVQDDLSVDHSGTESATKKNITSGGTDNGASNSHPPEHNLGDLDGGLKSGVHSNPTTTRFPFLALVLTAFLFVVSAVVVAIYQNFRARQRRQHKKYRMKQSGFPEHDANIACLREEDSDTLLTFQFSYDDAQTHSYRTDNGHDRVREGSVFISEPVSQSYAALPRFEDVSPWNYVFD